MSTRSAVGVVVPGSDSWEGRYVHNDGWPSHMGRWLFHHLRKHDNPAQWLKSLLEAHPGGFSSLFLSTPEFGPYLGDEYNPPNQETFVCHCHSPYFTKRGLSADEWGGVVYGHEEPSDMEWAYVTNGTMLFVHKAIGDRWMLVSYIPLSDDNFENAMPWEAVQCFADGRTFTWQEMNQ